jgi:hypothetical protein
MSEAYSDAMLAGFPLGSVDLALSLVYVAFFVALLVLSYLSIWRRNSRN